MKPVFNHMYEIPISILKSFGFKKYTKPQYLVNDLVNILVHCPSPGTEQLWAELTQNSPNRPIKCRADHISTTDFIKVCSWAFKGYINTAGTAERCLRRKLQVERRKQNRI